MSRPCHRFVNFHAKGIENYNPRCLEGAGGVCRVDGSAVRSSAGCLTSRGRAATSATGLGHLVAPLGTQQGQVTTEQVAPSHHSMATGSN